MSNVKRTTIVARTDGAGRVRPFFVAGYLGGSIRLIASASVDGQEIADTAALTIRVPDLISLEDRVANVYWIGGNNDHLQGDNWFFRPHLVDELQEIADSLMIVDTINGIPRARYLQYNDASLPLGGSFTVFRDTLNPPPSGLRPEDNHRWENPYLAHLAHAVGLDIDIAWCYTEHQGNDGGEANRVKGTNCVTENGFGPAQPDLAIAREELDAAAAAVGGVNRVHSRNHYHIRFQR